MIISYRWLQEFFAVELSPAELSERMTFGGIEVEAVTPLGKELTQIKVAEIVGKKEHPQADKLTVCKVNDGENLLQVVCGAANCAVGQKVALAPVGSQLGDYKINRVRLRGVESYGMLCSEKELGISEDHEGIMILPPDAPPGQDLASYLQLDDTVFEVEITPNRPDLLGILGIARDVAALLDKPLKELDYSIAEGNDHIKNHLALENLAPDLCTRYTARMIRGVKIKESPSWLKRKLVAVGLRPINNVVDITNYVMIEMGHPLHAFDYNLIKGRKIVVRRAREQEKFPALDEQTYILRSADLVIADTEKPVALAGIIGGENSHITEQTVDVVIEAANFLYSSIRKTASYFMIATDSSYRFERDLADETADLASRRACQLILDLAGGELLQDKLDSFPGSKEPVIVSLRRSRVKSFLTLDLTSEELINYLSRLHLSHVRTEDDVLYFSIPSFRKDLAREIDLIEEVIRLHGYNNVPTFMKTQNIMDKHLFYTRRKVKNILVDLGFSEVINWNFADPAELDKLKIPADDPRRHFVTIKNPLGSSYSIMRSMLLPDLLKNARYNIHHGQKDLKLFEMAKVFTRHQTKLAREKYHLTGLETGRCDPVFWREHERQVDFFDIKGVVERLLPVLGCSEVEFRSSTESFYQKNLAADVFWKDKKILDIGKIDTQIAETYEIERPVFVFNLDLSLILSEVKKLQYEYTPVPKFPAILRDLSFVVAKNIPLAEIERTIYQVDAEIIQKIELYDQYEGGNIQENYRSLTFSLIFNSFTKTLTDEYINNIVNKVITKLQDDFQIEMR